MNNQRQATQDSCEGMGIPIKDAMAMLNTDYTSEARTCRSDTEFLDSTVDRQVRASLGQATRKVIGLE